MADPIEVTTAPPSERTKVRRLPARGRYDAATVHAILDAGFVCHLGFALDATTWVVPTVYGRAGDDLFVHGAVGNHALRALASGVETCVTVTLVDGLVLARSAFHHSVNYRSVMVFGVAELVTEPEAKAAALEVIVDHVVPGRMAEVRRPTASEMRTTAVLRLPLTEASAKVRTGGPVDDEEDLSLPVWAGVLPLTLTPGVAEPDTGCEAMAVPPSASVWGMGGRR